MTSTPEWMTYASFAFSGVAVLMSGAGLHYSRVVHRDNGGRAQVELVHTRREPWKDSPWRNDRVVFRVRNVVRGPMTVIDIIYGQGAWPNILILSWTIKSEPELGPMFKRAINGPELPMILDGGGAEQWLVDTAFYRTVVTRQGLREVPESILAAKQARIGVVLADNTKKMKNFKL